MNYVVACSEADSPKAVVAEAVDAPARRKRGRPKKVKKPGSAQEDTDEEEEEEWEFFGELARHLQHGAPSEEDQPTVEVASGKAKHGEIDTTASSSYYYIYSKHAIDRTPQVLNGLPNANDLNLLTATDD